LVVFEHKIPDVTVSPATLKKYATHNAGAKKEAMVKAAMVEGVSVADDNQADAFFLAMIARNIHTGIAPRTRVRMDVIHQLQHPTPKPPARRLRKLTKNSL
jgi:hypothetical protein